MALEQWASDGKVVKITIVRYPSQEEAAKSMREFAASMRANRSSTDSGEEGYSWGSLNSFVFRKHNFLVYIYVKGSDAEDEKQLRKQFARLIVDAIHN
ncbi:MAG: hypothetical protein AUG51_00270 [Acidobacteria bacterium 13_1_20CM_3_53_8]|nr:MAG: hypothetical protein AUG51_00270 [Acidobacteria bacterium 13_1_20CM_3_53_8]